MDLNSVCVFSGSSPAKDPAVEKEVREFARGLASRGIRLVYGGSARGLMGALADEMLSAGGKVIGVMPKALQAREEAHRGLTELELVDTMHEREQRLFDLSDAFVAFPGGFGTLEEMLERLTWKQVGIHGKPIVFANLGGYFDPLLAQFDAAIRAGYARPETRILYGVADSTRSVFTFLEGAPVLPRKAGDWA